MADSPATAPSRTETAHRTSVVIIGAGPAGLTLANVLHAAGVGCVVLEAESREFIEQRPRAGFIEEWVVHALDRHGLAGRLLERAERQRTFEFRWDGERHVVEPGKFSGQSHFVYPQPLLVTDLVAAYADAARGDIRFGVRDVRPAGIDTDRPSVSYTDPETGERHRIDCAYIAGCDGARSVARAAIPADELRISRLDYGIGWLALLAEAPPSAEGVVFGLHERGFSAHMARTPEVTRYYLECPPGDDSANWPHERIWSELRTRLAATGAQPLAEGRIIEKTVLDMHNYVVEPMGYGRVYLAGESAHLVAPIAAKGMNLAIHDALLLAGALVAACAKGDESALGCYSDACLAKVWQYQEFSQWLSEVMHGPSSGDRFRAGTAAARLRRLLASDAAAAAFGETYLGSATDIAAL
ncbi:4-hydroxybenzoate 3-monooxygenase [Streptomyces sp. NPDC053542]|uniref:4-hydroxybenzoate 3-monooxygenase n=1 Tax=Streptomyces sp. NPDC053542 TaxID=3365710 RepID=UPI0037D096D4